MTTNDAKLIVIIFIMLQRPNILLVDASNVSYCIASRCEKRYAGQLSHYTNDKIIKQTILNLVTRDALIKYTKRFNVQDPSNVYLCFDTRRQTLWRKTIFPGYKQGRDKKKRSSLQAVVHKSILHALRFQGELLNMQIMEHAQSEADDVVKMTRDLLKFKYQKKNINAHFIILSNDSDFQQLVCQDTEQISPLAHTSYSFTRFPGKTADEILQLKCVMGDRSDSVPSIMRGFGKVKSEKLLQNGNLHLILQDKVCEAKYLRNSALIDLKLIPFWIQKTFYMKHGLSEKDANRLAIGGLTDSEIDDLLQTIKIIS